MELRTLGRTGVKVSPLCLGAMMFGAWGETRPRQVDRDHPPRARRRRSTSSTPPTSTPRGESEEIVGKALAGGRRDDVILATKVHGSMGDDPNQFGNSRRWIIREVENSLRRLGTDWIDLYQIHRPEQDTDIDETLGALTDLVRQGKVRYIGSSTFPASQIVEAQWTAERRGRERFVCEQPPYSLLVRGDRGGRAADGAGATAWARSSWSPLAGGWLSGKWRKGADDLTSRRSAMIPARYDLSIPANQRKLDAADALGAGGRGGGPDADRAGAGVRAAPPRGHRRDHRAAHDGAPRVAARRGGRRALRRRARPHRRDRAAGRERQPGATRG